MCISPNEWETVTPYYFLARLDGMRKRDTQIYRSDMERTRWLAALILSPHGKKGRPIEPRKIITFPWEKQTTEEAVDFITKNKKIFDKLRL